MFQQEKHIVRFEHAYLSTFIMFIEHTDNTRIIDLILLNSYSTFAIPVLWSIFRICVTYYMKPIVC